MTCCFLIATYNPFDSKIAFISTYKEYILYGMFMLYLPPHMEGD